MVDVKLRLTEDQWDAILQVAYDASTIYDKDIPANAVIMAACMKGLGAVRYEMSSETSKLRLVVSNERTRDSRRDLEAFS